MKTEFEFIQNIKKSYGLNAVGDDCAIIPKDAATETIVTADLLVEDIDFRLKWTDAESLGWKSLAVSLSDIAAMGGVPKWAMLTVAVPENLWKADWLERFYHGWHQLAAKFKVELVGGDVSRSPDRFVVDSIVAGEVPRGKAVLRSGAQPGDGIFVSGTIGGAAGGLKVLEGDIKPTLPNDGGSHLIKRHSRPSPRIELGIFLRENELTSAMIDLSDGLSSDIRHICEASKVGAAIEIENLPIDANLSGLFDREERLSMALNGGEDFELLFSVPQENVFALENADVSRVGMITEKAGVIELISSNSRMDLTDGGFRHF